MFNIYFHLQSLELYCQQQQLVTFTTVLTLATLGNATQIKIILFVSLCLRWSSQIHSLLHRFERIYLDTIWGLPA
jgi:hypothetical protein